MLEPESQSADRRGLCFFTYHVHFLRFSLLVDVQAYLLVLEIWWRGGKAHLIFRT